MRTLLISCRPQNGDDHMTRSELDEIWMREALKEAAKAADVGEVPVGAVAVSDEKIIGRAHNLRERTHNPLGHAELLLIEGLARSRKSWRLEEVEIYVTCEPCLMCSGAILQARIPRVVFGCSDPKAGAMGTLYDVTNDPRLNHRIEVVRGVLAKECSEVLSEFFKKVRKGLISTAHEECS